MKRKILKTMIGILLIMIGIALLIVSYFLFADIKTKVPKEIENICNIETRQYMNRDIFIITPKEGCTTNKKIIYFHGGSYIAEATQKNWDFVKQLVIDTGAMIILPDYPLAPKYTYKDVFNMTVPLYKEIIEQIEPQDLILMGDSAGGGLTLALLENLGNENIQMPSKTILISPWLDVRLTNSKIDEVQKNDTELNKETLKLAGIAYAGTDGINNYLVNPIDGELSKLENVTIFAGTYDILTPDAYVLQEKAKLVNVDIELKEYEQAKHIWIIEKNSSQELIDKAYHDLLNLINS